MTATPVLVLEGKKASPDWTQTGVIVVMADGARWFHPYDGGKPRRIGDLK